ncbi:MAG TPA: polysaccharide pyruvyl transferase family protein [Stenomitos sp.]
MSQKNNAIKNILIVNVYGSSNSGDAALLDSLINSIYLAFGSNINIEGIAYLPELEKEKYPAIYWYRRFGTSYQKNIFLRRFLNLYYQILCLLYFGILNLGFKPFNFFALPTSQRQGIDSLFNSDIVISCPGGYFEDSNYSYISNLIPIYFACKFNKIVTLAPQSIGPINSRIGKLLVKSTLSKVDLICLREKISYYFTKDVLDIPQNKLVLTHDMAFFLKSSVGLDKNYYIQKVKDDLNFDLTKPFVGLSVISWSFPQSQDPISARQKYIQNLAILCKLIIDNLSMPVLIINQVNEDLPATLELNAQVSSGLFFYDHHFRDLHFLKFIISQSSVFIGSRFHSCIFSLMSQVPTIAISYLPKTRGIMQELNLSERVHEIDAFNPESIFKQVLNDLNNKDQVSELIRNKVSDYQGLYPQFSELLQKTQNNENS